MVSPTNISAPVKTTSTHRASIATSHYFLGVAYIDHTLYKFLNKLVVHSQNQNIPVWNNRHFELTTGLLISCSWLTLSFFLDNIPINVLRHWSLSLWCKEKCMSSCQTEKRKLYNFDMETAPYQNQWLWIQQ